MTNLQLTDQQTQNVLNGIHVVSLNDAQVASVKAQNPAAPPVVVTPPPSTGGKIPNRASDGSTIVTGARLDVWDGLGRAVKIANGQTAVFPVVMPTDRARVQLAFTEKGDSMDSTPRRVWVSKTPGNVESPNLDGRRMIYGVFNDGGIMMNGGSGGAINFKIGQDSRLFADRQSGTIEIEALPGEVWYLMVQNKDSRGRDSATIQGPNFTVFPNPINN